MFVYIIYLLGLFTLPSWVKSQVQGEDYYWRPYDGAIPTDALRASYKYDVDFFIGRVPIPGVGLQIGTIREGYKEMSVADGAMITPDGPVHVRSDHIEIFCTRHPDKFWFLSVNASTLHNFDAPAILVPGAYEGPNLGTLYIGRTLWRDGPPPSPYYYKVGKVVGYNYNASDIIYVADGDRNVPVEGYEVLTWWLR